MKKHKNKKPNIQVLGMKRGIKVLAVFALLSVLFVSAVSASRLPAVGGDSGSWGSVLNDFLLKITGKNATQLNLTMVNGTNIYPSSINTTHIEDGTITSDDLGTSSVSDDEINYTSVTLADFTNDASYITSVPADSVNGTELADTITLDANMNVLGYNFSVNNSDLFVDIKNGRVGIGTTTPSSELQVVNGTNTLVTIGNQESSGTESRMLWLGKSSGGTAISADWHLQAGRFTLSTQGVSNVINVGTVSGAIRLQAETVSSNSPVIVAGRTWTGTGNTHAFVDEQSITGSANSGHNSFDADGTYNGSNDYDHVAGFQARPSFQGSGTINKLIGYTSAIDQQDGTISVASHYQSKDITGSGTVNNQYGFLVRETMSRASNNWAFYANGTTPSYFGGNLTVNLTLNVTGNIIASNQTGITGNFTTGNCWQSFRFGIMFATNCTSLQLND